MMSVELNHFFHNIFFLSFSLGEEQKYYIHQMPITGGTGGYVGMQYFSFLSLYIPEERRYVTVCALQNTRRSFFRRFLTFLYDSR